MTRFSLEAAWKNPIHLKLSLYESIVGVTIRGNEWAVHRFPDVVIIKFSLYSSLQAFSLVHHPT